jgi:hypothetical protein
MGAMRRVVVLGRGGAGKSTLAVALGEITGLPVVELDALFWRPGPVATPPDEWVARLSELVRSDQWIMDGDLGPFDAVDIRLRAADTVILLDLPALRCAGRALRRGRESLVFWRWLLLYRRRSLPPLLAAIATHAPGADLVVLRSPRAVRRFLAGTVSGPGRGGRRRGRARGAARW